MKGTAFNINTPLSGEYTLAVSSSKSLDFLNSLMMNVSSVSLPSVKHGYAVVYNADADRIYSHLAAYTQQKGDQVLFYSLRIIIQKVGLVSRMYSSAAFPTLALGQVPNALTDVVQTARLEAVFPDGHRSVQKPRPFIFYFTPL